MRASTLGIKSVTMKKSEFLSLHDNYFNRLIKYFICLLFGFMHFRTSIDTLLEGANGLWRISSIIICFFLLIIGFIGFFIYLKRLSLLIAEYKNSA
jgi:hypothetical protein